MLFQCSSQHLHTWGPGVEDHATQGVRVTFVGLLVEGGRAPAGQIDGVLGW